MKQLTKIEAIQIINWYDTIGVNNWGVWSDYPKLSFGASYHSFDVCHCRIKFDCPVIIGDEEYTGVADVRNQLVPGAGNYLDIEYLKEMFLDGYLEQKRATRKKEEENCFTNFDYYLFAQIIKEYPLEANKKQRRAFERLALEKAGFISNNNISQSTCYHLAQKRCNELINK